MEMGTASIDHMTLPPSYILHQRRPVVPVPGPVAAEKHEGASRGAQVERQLGPKKQSRASTFRQGREKKFC